MLKIDSKFNHPGLEDDFFNKYEKALYYEIFQKGEYDFLLPKIKNSKLIFDIGSHIGLFSLFCLQNSKNNSLIIHSFEASKINFNKSLKLLKNYSKNIKIQNKFISYKNGKIDFYFNEKKTMQSSLYSGNFLNNSKNSVKIQSIDLFDYILSQNLNFKNSIDIAKIDIEGYEFDLLENINPLFFDFVKNLVFEFHILSDEFTKKCDLLLEKLSLYYKNISTKKSDYSDKIGIIFCEK